MWADKPETRVLSLGPTQRKAGTRCCTLSFDFHKHKGVSQDSCTSKETSHTPAPKICYQSRLHAPLLAGPSHQPFSLLHRQCLAMLLRRALTTGPHSPPLASAPACQAYEQEQQCPVNKSYFLFVFEKESDCQMGYMMRPCLKNIYIK